jgi:hypothetical protein
MPITIYRFRKEVHNPLREAVGTAIDLERRKVRLIPPGIDVADTKRMFGKGYHMPAVRSEQQMPIATSLPFAENQEQHILRMRSQRNQFVRKLDPDAIVSQPTDVIV